MSHNVFLDVSGYSSYRWDMSILDQVPFNEEYVITHFIHAIYQVKKSNRHTKNAFLEYNL